MKRVLSYDIVKGILAIMIIYIHVGTFLIGKDNFNMINKLLYSFGGIAVPLFFIISGYFDQKTKNLARNIYKLIKTYFIYTTIILIFNVIFLNENLNVFTLINTYFVYSKSVGYLWFIKNLIIYKFIIYLFKENNKQYKKYIIIYMFINLVLYFNEPLNNRDFQFLFYLVGYWISFKQFKISKYYSLFIFLIPVINNYKYTIFNIPMFLILSIFFVSISSLNITKNPIKILSRNTLQILFVHYFYVEILQKFIEEKIINLNYLSYFLILTTLTIITVYIMEIFTKNLQKNNI